MQHRKVSDEAMKLIFENAGWSAFGFKFTKDEPKKVDEAKKEPAKEPIKEEAKPEKHVCPLCETELKEAIPDARLIEHTKNMVEVLTEAEEEIVSEDDEVDEDEDVDFEDFEDEDEEEVDEDEVEEEE